MAIPTETSTFVTGLCTSGGHAGKRVRSPGGLLYGQCPGVKKYQGMKVITCSCWCHALFAEFAVSEEVPISVLPGPALQNLVEQEDTTSSFFEEALKNPLLEVQLRQFIYKLILKADPPQFNTSAPRTDGGRRVPGALELNVEAVCRLFVAGVLPYDKLRPSDIGMLADTLDPPSNGAIHAVLTRWQEHNLCNLSSDPFAFLSFTDRVPTGGVRFVLESDRRASEQRTKGFISNG